MTDSIGTDSRRYDFFLIDNEVIDEYDLGPYAGWLYVVIIRHIDRVQRTAFPSLSTLAKECGMSEPTVIKYMSVLVEKNLLRIHQETSETGAHSQNLYEALPVVKKQGVVKEINQGGKPALPGVVKEVKCNNTKENKTQEPDVVAPEKTPAAAAAAVVEPTEPTSDPTPERDAETVRVVVKAYEGNMGIVTQIIRDELLEAIDTYPSEWIVDAIAESVRNNVRRWSYAAKILERWARDGRGDPAKKGEAKPAIHLPTGIEGCKSCGGAGFLVGPDNKSVPCPACLEAERNREAVA